jgi:hypothetical protein
LSDNSHCFVDKTCAISSIAYSSLAFGALSICSILVICVESSHNSIEYLLISSSNKADSLDNIFHFCFSIIFFIFDRYSLFEIVFQLQVISGLLYLYNLFINSDLFD